MFESLIYNREVSGEMRGGSMLQRLGRGVRFASLVLVSMSAAPAWLAAQQR